MKSEINNKNQYALVRFYQHSNEPYAYMKHEILYELNFPREVIQRRMWVVTWIDAILKCRTPKMIHGYSWHFYYPDTKTEIEDAKLTLSSYKGQITKIQKAILSQVKYNRANDLFFDIKTDTDIRKAYVKLEEKRKQYNQLKQHIETNLK